MASRIQRAGHDPGQVTGHDPAQDAGYDPAQVVNHDRDKTEDHNKAEVKADDQAEVKGHNETETPGPGEVFLRWDRVVPEPTEEQLRPLTSDWLWRQYQEQNERRETLAAACRRYNVTLASERSANETRGASIHTGGFGDGVWVACRVRNWRIYGGNTDSYDQTRSLGIGRRISCTYIACTSMYCPRISRVPRVPHRVFHVYGRTEGRHTSTCLVTKCGPF